MAWNSRAFSKGKRGIRPSDVAEFEGKLPPLRRGEFGGTNWFERGEWDALRVEKQYQPVRGRGGRVM